MTDKQLTEVRTTKHYDVEKEYWMVIVRKNPIVTKSQLPIFFSRTAADYEAKKFGGIVVKAKVSWNL